MTAKQIQLAQKLKALADKGIDGEKANAQQLLQRYLNKNGLTMEDIDSEVVKSCYLNLGTESETAKLFKQIVASVLGNDGDCYYLNKQQLLAFKKARYVGFTSKSFVIHYKATESEKAEIMAKMDFYIDEYRRQKSIFYSAFIQKNELYSNPQRTEESDVEQDEEEIKALIKMMRGFDKGQMYQKLNMPSKN